MLKTKDLHAWSVGLCIMFQERFKILGREEREEESETERGEGFVSLFPVSLFSQVASWHSMILQGKMKEIKGIANVWYVVWGNMFCERIIEQ